MEYKVEVKRFADGQLEVNIPDIEVKPQRAKLEMCINTYEDIFLLAHISDILSSFNATLGELHLYSLLGMRSDREFSHTSSIGLVPIVNMINESGSWRKVIVYEPHSKVTTDWLICSEGKLPIRNHTGFNAATIIFPDKGAKERYAANSEALYATKIRDKNNLPDVTIDGIEPGKRYLIVDDYCDGGRTFTNLAAKLYDAGAKEVGLSVWHGLFSYGFKPLADAGITYIWTTDNIKTSNELHQEAFINPTIQLIVQPVPRLKLTIG